MSTPVIKYDRLEDEIVERLTPIKTANPAILIEAAPDNHSDFARTGKFPAIWVLVEGERYGQRNDTGIVTQDSDAVIVISIQARQRRGVTGVRYLAQLVKERLLGFRGSDYDKFTLREDQHEIDDNVWKTRIVFEASSVIVEKEDPADVILLQEITYETSDDANWFQVPDTNNPEDLDEPAP